MRDAETTLTHLEKAARARYFECQNIARLRVLKADNVPPVPPYPKCGELSVDYWERTEGSGRGPRFQIIYRVRGKGVRGRKPALAYMEDFLNGEQTRQTEFCQPPA